MKAALKGALLALAGAAYGFLSFWWLIYSWAFVAFPLAERGTKEWAEDAMFIPLGVFGLVLWLASAGYLLWKLRRKKRAALLFWGAALLAGAAVFMYLWRLWTARGN